jgi:hypothetical protein
MAGVETLIELYAETGQNTFVLRPADDAENQVRLFSRDVAPAIREALRRRGG